MEVNEVENFRNAQGVFSVYTLLDTSLEKLHKKYTALEAEWREISNKCEKGTGLATEKEPTWYKILNPIFSEEN